MIGGRFFFTKKGKMESIFHFNECLNKRKEVEDRFIGGNIPFYRKKTSCGNYSLPLQEEI